jgi:hypothetical protein
MSLILSDDGVRWLRELQKERGAVVFYDDNKEEIHSILYAAASFKNPVDRDIYSRIVEGTYYQPKPFELEEFIEYLVGKSSVRSHLERRAQNTIAKLYDGGYLEDF